MSTRPSQELALGLRPFSRGMAFALFESPMSPVDWGIKEVRGTNRTDRTFDAGQQLINRMQPDILVLEDRVEGGRSIPASRLRLHRRVEHYAHSQAIDLYRYSRQQIRACFAGVGAQTRYEIARAIAAQVHAFEHQLPQPKRLWESEDPRMHVFDAASLIMTYYCANGMKSMSRI